jgi:hypothetical protein
MAQERPDSSPQALSGSSPQDHSSPSRSSFWAGVREFLLILSDFGMPLVAFGTGIYAFFFLFHLEMATELKAAFALALVLLGIGAQLWSYARTNPRVQPNEVRDQLDRMTELVERLVEKLTTR